MLKEITTNMYHLLHPKMVFFLTSVSRTGRANVMASAWATPVSEEPPMVMVCVEKESYTADLIRESRQFVINIPTKKLLPAIFVAGSVSGRNVDKFKKARLKSLPARKVKAPVIEGCIGYVECRLIKTVLAGECYAFFGSVVSSYAEERLFKKGVWIKDAEIPLHLGFRKITYFV